MTRGFPNQEQEDVILECIDGRGKKDGCEGKVEFRMNLSDSGVNHPRCEHHWAKGLNPEADRPKEPVRYDRDHYPSDLQRKMEEACQDCRVFCEHMVAISADIHASVAHRATDEPSDELAETVQELLVFARVMEVRLYG